MSGDFKVKLPIKKVKSSFSLGKDHVITQISDRKENEQKLVFIKELKTFGFSDFRLYCNFFHLRFKHLNYIGLRHNHSFLPNDPQNSSQPGTPQAPHLGGTKESHSYYFFIESEKQQSKNRTHT